MRNQKTKGAGTVVMLMANIDWGDSNSPDWPADRPDELTPIEAAAAEAANRVIDYCRSTQDHRPLVAALRNAIREGDADSAQAVEFLHQIAAAATQL